MVNPTYAIVSLTKSRLHLSGSFAKPICLCILDCHPRVRSQLPVHFLHNVLLLTFRTISNPVKVRLKQALYHKNPLKSMLPIYIYLQVYIHIYIYTYTYIYIYIHVFMLVTAASVCYGPTGTPRRCFFPSC